MRLGRGGVGGSGGTYGGLLGDLVLVVVVGDGALAARRHGEVGGSVRQLRDGLRSGARAGVRFGTCTNVCAARAMASVEAASVARTRCLALSASLLLSVTSVAGSASMPAAASTGVSTIAAGAHATASFVTQA